MALPAKAFSFLFLAISLLSHHSQARDSQFFSKVPNINTNEKETATPTTTTTTTVVNPNKQEQEPTFIPDTQKDGYGLYGHEYGQLPPSDQTAFNGEQHYTTTTTKTYKPYTTPVGPHYGTIEKEEEEEEQDQPPNNFNNAQFYSSSSNNENENGNYYNQNAVKETRGYKNNYNYNKNNNYYNGQERQGMSDTRFMEDGKYFHDNSKDKPNTYDDKYYDPNTYRTGDGKYQFYGHNANENSYKNNRYNKNYYNNNNYNNNNSFEGYQNEEFQESYNEFEP